LSHRTEVFEVGDYEIATTRDAGPRILRFARGGGPSLFAELPGVSLESRAGRLALLGGHRLWRAPEIPQITWEPDDKPVEIERLDDGFLITGAPDRDGMVKSIAVREGDSTLMVEHELSNRSASTVRCAPWAITQLTPGGVAILPLPAGPLDADGVLPNRSIVLWPYTDLTAPELTIGATDIRVTASATAPATKVGTQNRRGWMAYAGDGEVFVKWSPLHDDAGEYADLGASIECYRNDRFIELETVGTLVDVVPGATVGHREVWALYELEGRTLDELLDSLRQEVAG
jgi:hypothetical protein